MKEYYLAGDPAKKRDFFGIVILERDGNIIKLKATKEIQMDYSIVADYIGMLYKKYNIQKVFLDLTGAGNVFFDMLTVKKLKVHGITLSNPMKVQILETTIRLQQEGRLRLPMRGAKELKQQLQEQERDLTRSGLIRLSHPTNVHDDLFWAFCIGCYCLKLIIDVPKGASVTTAMLREKEDIKHKGSLVIRDVKVWT